MPFYIEPHPYLSHPAGKVKEDLIIFHQNASCWQHWALALQDGGSGGQSGHLNPERSRSRSGSVVATIYIYIYMYIPSYLLTDLQTCNVERSLGNSLLGYREAPRWCRIWAISRWYCLKSGTFTHAYPLQLTFMDHLGKNRQTPDAAIGVVE